MVATALELLLYSPREVSFKEVCRSSALWEPRMLQVSQKTVSHLYVFDLFQVYLRMRPRVEGRRKKK